MDLDPFVKVVHARAIAINNQVRKGKPIKPVDWLELARDMRIMLIEWENHLGKRPGIEQFVTELFEAYGHYLPMQGGGPLLHLAFIEMYCLLVTVGGGDEHQRLLGSARKLSEYIESTVAHMGKSPTLLLGDERPRTRLVVHEGGRK